MKTLLLSTCAMLATGTLLAQIPNGGFETWVNVAGYEDPASWSSFNSNTFPFGGLLVCEEGTPGAVGNSYVKLTTVDAGLAGTVPGMVYSTDDPTGPAGFPHSLRSGTLTGKWKYDIQAGDQGVITVAMKKWDGTGGAAIGGGVISATGTQGTWQDFSIPITYLNGLDPDSALIYIWSSGGVGTAGSTISVDDLAFGAVTGVDERTTAPSFVLTPSAATDLVRIEATERMASYSIVDLRGREVGTALVNGQPMVVDVTALQAGSYWMVVRFADGRQATRPFMKQ